MIAVVTAQAMTSDILALEPVGKTARGILSVYGITPSIQTNPVINALFSTNSDVRAKACTEGITAGYTFGGLGLIQVASLLNAPEAIAFMTDHDVPPDDRAGPYMPTALHLAILTGNDEAANLLLARGADPEAVIGKGRSAFSLAAMFGRTSVFERIHASGISIDAADAGGMTPLSCAARAGQTQMAGWIIRNGADVNRQDKQGLTPLHYATIGNHRDIVRLLLDHEANQGFEDARGHTPLWLAVKLARLEPMRELSRQPEYAAMAGTDGETPFYAAMKLNRLDVLDVLAESGVDLNQRFANEQTMLHLAVLVNATNSIKWLANHTDKNAQDIEGYTPLARAVFQRHPSSAKVLIDQEVDVDRPINSGFTPLMLAVNARNNNLVTLLLSAGANPDTPLPSGETPVMHAAAMGDAIMLAMLFDAGASGEGFTDRGHGIFDFALEQNNTLNMKILLEKGLDPTVQYSPDKWPVILTAAWRNRGDVIDLLLNHGVDVNTTDIGGQTALMVAARRGHSNLVRKLIDRGADVTLRTPDGETAWHVAEVRGLTEIAGELAARMTLEQRMPTNRITVYFDLDAPLATNVSVAGLFNEWNSSTHPMHKRSDDGWWYTEVNVFPFGYKYKYVVDGDWILDPINEKSTKDSNAGYTDSSFKPDVRTPDKRPVRTPSRADAFKTVAFTYASPEAGSVSVAGEFNGWNTRSLELIKGQDGTWSNSTIIRPGEYGYKLVVDNVWMLDPANPEVRIVDNVTNSLLRVSE